MVHDDPDLLEIGLPCLLRYLQKKKVVYKNILKHINNLHASCFIKEVCFFNEIYLDIQLLGRKRTTLTAGKEMR